MNRRLREFVLRYRLLRSIRSLIQKLIAMGKPALEEQSWGNDLPGCRFLVIRRGEPGVGLFSHFISVLGWLRFAEANGMIPVVDMQYDRNLYQEKSQFGKVNSWTLYFEQPCKYDIVDIERAHNVAVARGFLSDEDFLPNVWDSRDDVQRSNLAIWKGIVSRYIQIRHDALTLFVNDEFEHAICSGKGVLGVLARGTDYVKLRPEGHPVQPTVEELIEKISYFEETEDWQFAYLYLVTEDRNVEQKFREQYSGRLLVAKQGTITYKDGYLSKCADVAHNKMRGAGYLKAIYDLSRCDYLIGGRTSGSQGAILLSNGFKGQYLFDKGCY